MQFLTLYATPVVYIAFARIERQFWRSRRRPVAAGTQRHCAGTRSSPPRRRMLKYQLLAPFVRRPIATTLLTDSGSVVGRNRLPAVLPIASLPLLAAPADHYRLCLTAGCEFRHFIASSVSSPLERQLGLISGLKEMRASPRFRQMHYRARVSALIRISTKPPKPFNQRSLPQKLGAAQEPARSPPTYAKANANGFPIIALALTSDAYELWRSSTMPIMASAQKLSQIDGIAAIFIGGSAQACRSDRG